MKLLAQHLPDISGVPDAFFKSWWQVAGWAFVVCLLVYDRFFRGVQKREISGRVVHEEEPEFADQGDLDELKDSVQQEKSTMAGQIAEVRRVFQEHMHSLSTEVLSKMADVKVMAERGDATIRQIETRLSTLERSHHDHVTRVQQRIDETIRDALRGKKA